MGVTRQVTIYFDPSRGNKMNDKNNDNPPNLTQQVFHKALFLNRPRSQSLSDVTRTHKESNTKSINEHCPPESDESNWTKVQGRKRPRNSPDNNNLKAQKQTKIDNYWLGQSIQITNSFDELPMDENNTEQYTEKISKPPPIFIDRVENIKPLKQLLDSQMAGSYELKILNHNKVKIITKTADVYRETVKQLEAKETEFYTYKLKQERSFKVVLKKIHPSTDIEDIKMALNELGHDATNIWNIKQSITKIPLHMFVVELNPKANNKQIYDIKHLLNCRISVEPPKPVRNIPQCANCQQYGHTKKYCFRKPRCIKCTGNHLSRDCHQKERSNSVKCVLCDGNHPANYKGCMVYKNLIMQKYPPLRPKTKDFMSLPKNSDNKAAPVPNNPQYKRNTYAEIIKKQQEPNVNSTNIETSEDMKQLLEMFRQITGQLCTMTNLLTNLMTVMTKSSNQSK